MGNANGIESKSAPLYVVFLDIDGVLHPWQSNTLFHSECCLCLQKIINYSGAAMVLSSTWRKIPTQYSMIQELMGLLELQPLIGHTEDLGEGADSRGAEILEWLSRHPRVRQWIAIDDMDLTSSCTPYGHCLRGHFVHTHRDIGLTPSDAELAIQLLCGVDYVIAQ